VAALIILILISRAKSTKCLKSEAFFHIHLDRALKSGSSDATYNNTVKWTGARGCCGIPEEVSLCQARKETPGKQKAKEKSLKAMSGGFL
jgi:hypothetical protein